MPFRVTFFAAHAIICIIMVYLEKEEQILEFLHLNATFGRLEQHELHLHSGLNLICAPNESGKSTWGSFICAMLYGLSTRDRGLMADKNRFAPWSGAAMQGRMDILSPRQRAHGEFFLHLHWHRYPRGGHHCPERR